MEIEISELDLTVHTSGLATHNEGENLLLKINHVGVDPPKLEVKSVQSGKEINLHQLKQKT